MTFGFPRPLLLVLILFTSFQLHATEVIIKGKAVGLENKYIDLVTYRDFLSLSEKDLNSVQVKADGSFELRFDTKETVPVLLKSGSFQSMLYCQAGKIYNIKLSSPLVSANQSNDLNLQFVFPEPGELNQKIIEFNEDYIELLVENEKAFVARRAAPIVKKFVQNYELELSSEQNYFQNYLKFNLAIIEESTLNNKAAIFNAHFKREKIEVKNFEYMNLFRQFYQKRFESIASGSSEEGRELIEAINKDTDYSKFITLLKNDKYISANDSLAELFGIYGLQETYYVSGLFKKRQVEKLLALISKKGIFKDVAANVLNELTYLTGGTSAPEISFTSINNQSITREQFKNKYVYIQFWSLSATSALRDMILLKELSATLGSKLEIISVNLNDSKKDIEQYLRNKNYDWHFCSTIDNRAILKDFKVSTAPFYVLIDKGGNILEYPARSPSAGIKSVIK